MHNADENELSKQLTMCFKKVVCVKRLLPWNEGSHFEDGVREQIKRRRLSLTTHAGKQTTVERPRMTYL